LVLVLSLIGSGAGLLVHQSLAAENNNPPLAAIVAVADDAQQEGKTPPDAKKDGNVPKEGQKPKDGEKPPVKAKGGKGEDVTLTGLISKTEMKRKRDDGTELNVTVYVLTEANGNKVQLPGPRISESGQLLDKFNLADFVGKQVTLTGRALVVVKATDGADAAPIRRATKVLAITEVKAKK
jgi:hypothetical protein